MRGGNFTWVRRTLEIAWIGKADIVTFADGIRKGFLQKGKQKNFQKALEQVHGP